jgi:hypothetical protein
VYPPVWPAGVHRPHALCSAVPQHYAFPKGPIYQAPPGKGGPSTPKKKGNAGGQKGLFLIKDERGNLKEKNFAALQAHFAMTTPPPPAGATRGRAATVCSSCLAQAEGGVGPGHAICTLNSLSGTVWMGLGEGRGFDPHRG